MSEAAEVVIIGAGFAGAATAYHLARMGVRGVVVLESERKAGAHASGKNAALCFQLIANLDEARLAIEGTRFYADPPPEFSKKPLLRRCGSLLVSNEDGRQVLEQAAADASKLGLTVAPLSSQTAVRRVPALKRARITAALHNPHDGVVDIRALLDAYLSAARRSGAKIRLGETVHEIHVRSGKIDEVVTAKDKISTRSIVNAAGAWAGEIGRVAGASIRSLTPKRRHIFQTTVATKVDPDWPFVWRSDADVYFRPEGDGLLMSACDAVPHPVSAPEVDEYAEAFLQDRLALAFPALAAARVVEARACLRTFSADDRFVIGRDPAIEGLIWVAALGGHGMSTSYSVGRLGAAAVVGERPAELEPFLPARFT